MTTTKRKLKTERMVLRVGTKQKKEWAREARKHDLSLSMWARQILTAYIDERGGNRHPESPIFLKQCPK